MIYVKSCREYRSVPLVSFARRWLNNGKGFDIKPLIRDGSLIIEVAASGARYCKNALLRLW
jgi:hypothetical protein